MHILTPCIAYPYVYPKVLYSSNICEILLYNRQLVVMTYELQLHLSNQQIYCLLRRGLY